MLGLMGKVCRNQDEIDESTCHGYHSLVSENKSQWIGCSYSLFKSILTRSLLSPQFYIRIVPAKLSTSVLFPYKIVNVSELTVQ